MGLRLGRFPPDLTDTGNSPTFATNNSNVQNNLFSGMGRMYPNGATGCIWIGSAHDNSIMNNECADNYGAGISVGPGVSFTTAYDYNNTVQHNLFHDLGEGVLVDFGCVHFANFGGMSYFSSGTDKFLNNICHDLTHAQNDQGQQAQGIYIDNNSQNVQANYNLIYRSSGGLFFNNVSSSCPGASCNNTVANNIFAYAAHLTNSNGGEQGQGAIKRGSNTTGSGDSFLDFTFKHNIVYTDLSNEYPQWVSDAGVHAWDCAAGVDCTQYFNFKSNGYYNPSITAANVRFYTNEGGNPHPWSLTGWKASPHPNEDGPDGGTTTYGNPDFTNPGCALGDDYTFKDGNLTTPIAFDLTATGFSSTYSAGRSSPALCVPSSSCAAAATFATQTLSCGAW
jgi:hypothetical protein